jgi:CMP-N,N'-diacetyllegionaminic acid synthase
MKKVALIPARSGSKRIFNKNIKILGKHPLLAYSICSAIESKEFDKIICATDSQEYAEVAKYYGAEVPMLRIKDISNDCSPDIEWVRWILEILKNNNESFEVFSILRPTSPFRQPDTIKRAMNIFLSKPFIDSLRAVEKCSQHPGKMWVLKDETMQPLIPLTPDSVPWHSSQYAALPEVYVQNASLEIAWTKTVLQKGSIAGNIIAPFITNEFEGLDVNTEFDWWKAEKIIYENKIQLININKSPFKF